MPDFTDLISQAKKMQEKMKETQEALKKIEVEWTSGGNVVKVIINGDIKQTDLKIRSSEEVRSDEIMDTRADIRKAKKLLNWSPIWTFEKGIKDIFGYG